MGRGTSKTSGKTVHDVMLDRKSNPKWRKGVNMAAEGFFKRNKKKR